MIAIPAAAFTAHDRAMTADFGGSNDDRKHDADVAMYAEYLRRTVMFDGLMTTTASGRRVELAADVLDQIAGTMTTAKCVELGRAVLRGDKDAVFQLMTEATNAAILASAEEMADQ